MELQGLSVYILKALSLILPPQIIIMSYEERRRPARNHMRTSMDIGMGLFYMIIGGFVLYFQAFGNMSLPAWISYLLGGMMLLGGGARLYRGLKVILPQKNADTSQGE